MNHMTETVKYKLTENNKTLPDGTVLYQIQALKDIPKYYQRENGICKKDDLGGWVQSEKNLSQTGNCWVWDNAQVWGNARVWGNAMVYNDAQVRNNAQVWGNARVWDNAMVYYDAMVYGNARVWGNAMVSRNAQVFGHAQVSGDAHVGNAMVFRNSWVYVPIDFNCDFNPWEMFQEIINNKENLPRFLGIHPDMDKIIEQKLKRN